MQKVAEFIKKHPDCTAGVVIFLITLLFFLPGLNFEPLPLDTSAYIGNEYLLTPTWENFIHHLKTPVLGLHSPLVMHSFMLDYWIWGKDLLIFGGRLHNIILHAANAVLFFFLLRQFKVSRQTISLSLPAVIFAVLCFALHPQRVESVIWVVERKDVQVLFCGLLSTLLFTCGYRKNNWWFALAGAFFFLLSFGAKPLMLLLPLILLLGIWVCSSEFEWKKSLKLLTPYLAVIAFYAALNAAQLGESAGGSAAGAVSAERLSVVNLNCTNYFFKTLLPLNTQPLYPVFTLDNGMLLLCILFWGMTAATVILSIIRWRYRKEMLTLWLPLLAAFGMALLPMAGFKSIGNAEFADRYSYYPSIFIWVAMALAYNAFAPRRTIWQFAFWAYGFLIVVLGFCYLQSWQSKESFINAMLIQKEKSHPTALRMASWHCLTQKDFANALTFASQAYEQTPEDQRHEAEVYLLATQGMVMVEQGDTRGIILIDQAITSPAWGRLRYSSAGFAEAVLLKAADLHLLMGDVTFARQCYLVLAELSMGSNPVRELSFKAYAAYLSKDYAEAERLIQQALEKSPDDPVLKKDLADYRKLKNLPAKAASN